VIIDFSCTWINSKFCSFPKYYTSCWVSHTQFRGFTET